MNVTVGVRWRPDRGHWQLYYYDPITGKRHARSARAASYKDALKAAALWQAELARNGPEPGVMSWEHFRTYFEDTHLAERSRKYAGSMATAMNRFESAVGVPRRLDMVDSVLIARAIQQWRKDRLSSAAIATYCRHLKAALRWAHRMGLIRQLPQFPAIRQGVRHMRGRPITTAEFCRMLRATRRVRPDDWQQWVRFLRGLWYSGLRLSEAIHLSWDAPPVRVDLETGRYPRVVFHAEGHKARRDEITPIAPDFARWLERTPHGDRHGRVLPLQSPRFKNHLISHVREVGRVIAAIGREANIVVGEGGKCATAHDLRRSFGTRWALKVRPLTLKRLMRHTSIDTTLRYYVDQDADDVAAELWR